MNKFLTFFSCAVFTMLQLTVMPMLKIGWLNYNFALACIVVVCLLSDKIVSIPNALIIALIYDIFASFAPGMYFIMYITIAFIVIEISKHILGANAWISVLFVFVATLITELLSYWIFYAFNGMAYNAFVLSKIILPQCLINCIVGLIFYWFYKFVLKLRRV